MQNPLQITDIKTDDSGIQILLPGRKKAVRILSNSQIIIRHKVISMTDLRVGDEILAYGFDITPNKKYNKKRKRVKSLLENRNDKNGKRAT